MICSRNYLVPYFTASSLLQVQDVGQSDVFPQFVLRWERKPALRAVSLSADQMALYAFVAVAVTAGQSDRLHKDLKTNGALQVVDDDFQYLFMRCRHGGETSGSV